MTDTETNIHQVASRYIDLRMKYAEMQGQRIVLLDSIHKDESLLQDYLINHDQTTIELDNNRMVKLRPEYTSDQFTLNVCVKISHMDITL
jgi:hypothetical protein